MDAHYTVLARRFRPQSFGDVVGQDNVSQALRNAILAHRVAHAYLFSGARGVGKTSMARILAKSLNCPNVKEAHPCNSCEICDGISAGNDIDVLEIDGASNRRIEDIRDLRANVNIKSMRTPYKIYIIDEVHMLTKEAFNALLKTLEEPPPNVKFIFCTTEPNKLPDTILSRCQRFDFGTIATSSIAERLEKIAAEEGKQVDSDAIDLVARRAAGSMRDSQSLFDQLLAFGGDQIGTADVHRLLGTASDERLAEITDALVERRRDTVLELLAQALDEGVQLGELADQMVNYLRDLMVAGCKADSLDFLSVSNANRAKIVEQSEKWGLETIVAAMQILSEVRGRIQSTNSGRALVELALVRISMLEDLETIADLVQHLKGEGGNTKKTSAASASKTRRPPIGSANRAPAAEPPLQKKTEQTDNLTETETSQTQILSTRIEFEAGCEERLWAQIQSEINDMLLPHIKPVDKVAISGPNRLELSFPRSYHFNKQYCERVEVLGQLEEIATRITGKSIRITFSVHQSETDQQQVDSANEKPKKNDRVLEAGDDQFVQHALSLFDAQIVKIEEISNRSEPE